MSYEDVDYYTKSEKKWKKYKKESYSSNSIDPSLITSYSHNNTSSKSPTFPRSYSQKATSKASSSSSSLYRSSSVRSPPSPNSPSSSNEGKSTIMGSLSKKSSAFGKKCTNLAKEQKAKFYIVKRCVSMLVSSRKNGDS